MANNRLEQLHQLYKDNPADPFLIFALAKEHEKMNDLAKALDHYLILYNEHAEYVGTYYHLGKLYERMDQPEKAWSTYDKGMSIARKAGDQHAFQELAGARLILGDEEE